MIFDPALFPGTGSSGGVSPSAEVCLPPRTKRVAGHSRPRGLRLPSSAPRNVRFGGYTPHAKGRTHAQKAGLRYERKVLDVLSSVYGRDFLPSPSILYEDSGGLHRAIPDGLLILPHLRRVIIVEVKLAHTERAWWQLFRLYSPLIVALYPGYTTRAVEICRSYDPAVTLPGPVSYAVKRDDLLPGMMGVWQWKL